MTMLFSPQDQLQIQTLLHIAFYPGVCLSVTCIYIYVWTEVNVTLSRYLSLSWCKTTCVEFPVRIELIKAIIVYETLVFTNTTLPDTKIIY